MQKRKCWAIALLALAAAAGAQENYSTWTWAKPIRINTSLTGGHLASTVTQFPLLIRLNAANAADIFSGAKTGGADLRFRRIPGPHLPYEIERWDPVNQVAEIWVRMDTVRANDTAQRVWIYWGKADAPAASSGAAVFNLSNGYQAVWHMNGAGAGGQVDENDATGGGLHAAQFNNNGSNPASNTATGSVGIGYYRTLASSSNLSGQGFVTSDPTKANLLYDQNYKVSAWVTHAVPGDGIYRTIVSKHDYQYTLRAQNITSAGNNRWLFFYGNQGGATGWPGVESTSGHPVTTGWTYLAGVRDVITGNLSIYVNGELSNETWYPETDGAQNTSTSVAIGRRSEVQDRFWNGAIDEVRVESAARREAWIKLEYDSQKPGANMLTFGAAQVPIGILHGGVPAASPGRLGVREAGGTFVFALPEDLNAEARLTVTDAQGRAVWSSRVERGARALAWNGLALNGRAPARGMYLARLAPAAGAGDGRSWEAKLAHTR